MPSPRESAIFNAARGIAGLDARRAFVWQSCGDDRILRARVENLLRVYDEEATFLQQPIHEVRPALADQVGEGPGERIGPYQLLEQIGEGGFGVVFLAEQQQPVRRRVALKVLRPGMESPQVVARFEAERQALALMDHPNIAKVHDGGETASGRPYFVMEFVRGVPVTEFCDREHLTVRQRLQLFISVCQAVQHAHQKGIIHRDLKPANVLVTSHDDTPVVKVIDFGIAKALGQNLTDKPLRTSRAELIGTPLYMSPEQMELRGRDIDTRSDIYALGVLLYELLTGTTPFDHERVGAVTLDEFRRIVREEEPAWPSARITTLADGASTASVNRQSDPKRLRRLFRGELDWIVMKCLEKDRTRRYETASGLARDIERYLRDEPVEASPPGAGYRLRKFVKRNKGRVVAAGLVLVALLAGLAGTTWGMIRAEQARQDAVSAQLAEAERAEGERRAREESHNRLAQIERGTEILASVFRDLDPRAEENEGATLRVLLGQRLGKAVQQLNGEAVGDPVVVARLQHLLGVSLRELGHLAQAEAVLVKACRTRERLLGADHLDTVDSKYYLAALYWTQGKYAPAETLHQEVLEIRTAQLGDDHADTLASKNGLALVYLAQGKYAPAETLLKEVLKTRAARLGDDHPYTLRSKHNLAAQYQEQGKYDSAERLLKEVLESRAATRGPRHPTTLLSKYNLAGLYHHQGKYAAAETLYQEVLEARAATLGPGHRDTLMTKNSLALVYRSRRKYALAEALHQEALEVQTATLGPDHPDTLASQNNLACLYWSMKKLERSIPLFEETLKRRSAKLGADHRDTLNTQANLGVNYRDAGRFADAIALLEEVRRKGRKYPQLASFANSLLTAYVRAGKTAEATALAAELVQASRQQFPADSTQLAAALRVAGKALLDMKAYADAERLLRASLSLYEKEVSDARGTYQARLLLGGTLLGQRKYADAERLLVQGYAGMKEHNANKPKDAKVCLNQALEQLVQLYDAWGKSDEAARWKEELNDAKARPNQLGRK